jgi:hypothetical protein
LSSYAIAPRAETEIHLAVLLARSGRLDGSLKYFADGSSRADFSRYDSSEVRRELAKALGGATQLDSRLRQIPARAASPSSMALVVALVDEHGKVLETEPANPMTPASLVIEAKSLTLPSISWPEHSIRSIRTMEFRQDGGKWSLSQSYVGQAAASPAAY